MLNIEDIDVVLQVATEQKRTLEVKGQAEFAQLSSELSTVTLQKLATVDYLHDNTFLSWLCNTKTAKAASLIEAVKLIYYAEKTDEILTVCKTSEAAEEIRDHFKALVKKSLGREVASTELFERTLPNVDFMAALFGFRYVPYDRDCMTGKKDVVPFYAKSLNGLIEIKLPYILKKNINKILRYSIDRLERLGGVCPALFQNLDKLPTLEELLQTLPDINDLDLETKQLFEKYEKLSIFRLQESDTAQGFVRILCDNFEELLTGLKVLKSNKYLQDPKEKKEAAALEDQLADLNRQLFSSTLNDKEKNELSAEVKALQAQLDTLPSRAKALWAAKKIEELRLPTYALGFEPELFKNVMSVIHQRQTMRLGKPCLEGQQMIIPCEMDFQEPFNPHCDKLTVMVADVSCSMDWQGPAVQKPDEAALVLDDSGKSVKWDPSMRVYPADKGQPLWQKTGPGRIDALVKAFKAQCMKLSKLPNQWVCVPLLGDTSRFRIKPMPVNEKTLQGILDNLDELAATHLREQTNVKPLLDLLKKLVDDTPSTTKIQIVLITDGQFTDYKKGDEAEIASKMPNRKVFWSGMGIDLIPGGVEDTNMTFILKQGCPKPSLTFCEAEKIDQKLDQLVLKSIDDFTIKVEMSVVLPNASKAELNKLTLQPVQIGRPSCQQLLIQGETLDILSKTYKASELILKITVTYLNGSTCEFVHQVPMTMFAKPDSLSAYNKLIFCQQWLESRCATEKLGDSRFLSDEVLSKLYTEAVTIQNPALKEFLGKRLKNYFDQWLKKDVNSKLALVKTKKERLNVLLGLQEEPQVIHETIKNEWLQREIHLLKQDPDVVIEIKLFEIAKIKNSDEFSRLNLQAQINAYEAIYKTILIQPETLQLDKNVDISVLTEQIKTRLNALLADNAICQKAGKSSMASVERECSLAQKFKAYEEALFAHLEKPDMVGVTTIISEKLSKIWMEGRFEQLTNCRFVDKDKGKGVPIVTQASILELMREQARKERRADVDSQLTSELMKIWKDATLCRLSETKTIAEFQQLPKLKQFVAFNEAFQIADKGSESENKYALESLQESRDALFIEASIFGAAKVDSMPKFLALPMKQQKNITILVLEKAKKTCSKAQQFILEDRLAAIEANEYILDQVKSLAELDGMSQDQQIATIDRAILEAEKSKKSVVVQHLQKTRESYNVEERALAFEVSERMNPEADNVDNSLNMLAPAFAACDAIKDAEVIDSPFEENIKRLRKLQEKAKSKGEVAMVTQFEKRIMADTWIETVGRFAVVNAMLEPGKKIKAATDKKVQASMNAIADGIPAIIDKIKEEAKSKSEQEKLKCLTLASSLMVLGHRAKRSVFQGLAVDEKAESEALALGLKRSAEATASEKTGPIDPLINAVQKCGLRIKPLYRKFRGASGRDVRVLSDFEEANEKITNNIKGIYALERMLLLVDADTTLSTKDQQTIKARINALIDTIIPVDVMMYIHGTNCPDHEIVKTYILENMDRYARVFLERTARGLAMEEGPSARSKVNCHSEFYSMMVAAVDPKALEMAREEARKRNAEKVKPPLTYAWLKVREGAGQQAPASCAAASASAGSTTASASSVGSVSVGAAGADATTATGASVADVDERTKLSM